MSLAELQCGVQQYEWGKDASESAVARLAKCGDGSSQKFAELWIGTHPSLPSTIKGTGQTLDSYAREATSPSPFFSASHQALPRFKDQVPFLLKVLSIGKALSIQAHPGRELAKVLHARDPKNYKDSNHKPELMVALTPFEALCCFRRIKTVASFVAADGVLQKLVGQPYAGDDDDAEETSPAHKAWLRAKLTALYGHPESVITAACIERLAAIEALDKASLKEEDALFSRLMRQYPNDVGCWMVYFLNIVHLGPGDGLFLSDCEPHSYLSGDGVEIMATSDNVVRAGLTPKFKDCDALLSMLTYDTNALKQSFHPRTAAVGDGGSSVQQYLPPNRFEDFSLQRVELPRGAGDVEVTIPTIGLGICVSGSGVVNGVAIGEGACVAVTPSVVKISNNNQSDHFMFFIASMNFCIAS